MQTTLGLLGAGGIALAVVLAGCGGGSAEPERQAAGEGTSAGSKLCVKNTSGKTVSLGAATISPGQEQCKEGNSLTSSDIAFDIQVDGMKTVYVEINNPYVGMGSTKLTQPDPFGQCLYESPAGQVKGSVKEDGVLRYQFERLTPLITDSSQPNFIEWTLTLSDPDIPSADGKPRKCY